MTLRNARSASPAEALDSLTPNIDSVTPGLDESGSRRLRLLGYVRSARLPASLLSFAFDASTATPRQLEEALLQGALVVLYPSYCRQTPEGYVTKVRGWVTSPGPMTKKNRLIISFARQLIKVDLDAEEPLASGDTASSVDSLLLTLSNADSLLSQRIAAFIARSVTNLALNIHVGSESPMHPDEIVQAQVVTDLNGHFTTHITTRYKPSLTHVHVASDETIFSMDEPVLVGTAGVSVISDIDDTIKLTGVTGEKRQLFTNVFATEVSGWTILGVAEWYAAMHAAGAQFHYVSNSPWQLYPSIQEFFKNTRFPLGLVHLKQYLGNLINSFMEPLVERKRASLKAILDDFPQRQFVCIGDSGEYDFDAYCELAKQHPGQVAAIYIRCVPGTFSDLNEREVLRDLRRTIQNWKTRPSYTRPPVWDPQGPNSGMPNSGVPNSGVPNSGSPTSAGLGRANTDAPLIDLGEAQRQGPPVPKKPESLKSRGLARESPVPEGPLAGRAGLPLDRSRDLTQFKPPLPARPAAEPLNLSPPRRRPPPSLVASAPLLSPRELLSAPPLPARSPAPPLPPRSMSSQVAPVSGGSAFFAEPIVIPSSQEFNVPGLFAPGLADRKGDAWRYKLRWGLDNLDPSIDVVFWSDAEGIAERAVRLVETLLQKAE